MLKVQGLEINNKIAIRVHIRDFVKHFGRINTDVDPDLLMQRKVDEKHALAIAQSMMDGTFEAPSLRCEWRDNNISAKHGKNGQVIVTFQNAHSLLSVNEGQHRHRAAEIVLEIDPDFEYYFLIEISEFDSVQRSQEIFSQQAAAKPIEAGVKLWMRSDDPLILRVKQLYRKSSAFGKNYVPISTQGEKPEWSKISFKPYYDGVECVARLYEARNESYSSFVSDVESAHHIMLANRQDNELLFLSPIVWISFHMALAKLMERPDWRQKLQRNARNLRISRHNDAICDVIFEAGKFNRDGSRKQRTGGDSKAVISRYLLALLTE